MSDIITKKTDMKVIQVEIAVNSFLADSFDLFDYKPDNDSVDIRAQLSTIFKGRGEMLDVNLDGDKAILRWGLTRSPQNAEAHNRTALNFARQRQFEQAIEEWRHAVYTSSLDPDYQYNLGLALFETKNYIKGLDHCKEAVKICPVYYRAYFVLGSIYSKMRKFELAEENIRIGLLFQPDNVNALINLGAIYSILRNYKAGITAFENAVRLSSKEAKAYLGLGKIYLILGDSDNANRCFRVVVKLDPDGKLGAIAKNSLYVEEPITDQPIEYDDITSENVEELYSDAYQSFLNGDYTRAVSSYQKYLNYKPRDAMAWSKLASCQLRLGQYEQAIRSIESALERGTEKSGLYKQASIIYDACNDIDKAGEAAAKAIELGKSDSVTLTLYGIAKANAGFLQEAAQIFQKAVTHNPNNQKARFNFGLVLKDLGQTEAAKQHFEEILWSDNSSQLKDRARQEIQSLM